MGLGGCRGGRLGLSAFPPKPDSLSLSLSHSACSRSMLLGVGSPPVDALSPLVLGIMAVALGAPALMLLAGGLFLLLGRKRDSEYQSIN